MSMTTSSKVTKLPNMHFRTWRVIINTCDNGVKARKLCRDNGVPLNPIFLSKNNPKLVFANK